VHVDVFKFSAEGELPLLNRLPDFEQSLLNFSALLGGDKPNLGKHLSVGDRAFDVLSIESAVKAHTFSELLDAMVGRLIENTPPRFISHSNASRMCKNPKKSTT
jgi:hypothetical protein